MITYENTKNFYCPSCLKTTPYDVKLKETVKNKTNGKTITPVECTLCKYRMEIKSEPDK